MPTAKGDYALVYRIRVFNGTELVVHYLDASTGAVVVSETVRAATARRTLIESSRPSGAWPDVTSPPPAAITARASGSREAEPSQPLGLERLAAMARRGFGAPRHEPGALVGDRDIERDGLAGIGRAGDRQQERGQGVSEQVGQGANHRVLMIAARHDNRAPRGSRMRARTASASAGASGTLPGSAGASSSLVQSRIWLAICSSRSHDRKRPGHGRLLRGVGQVADLPQAANGDRQRGAQFVQDQVDQRNSTGHLDSYGLPVTGYEYGFMNFLGGADSLLSRCRTWRPAVAALPRLPARPSPARLHLNYHHGRCPLVRSARC